MRCMRVLGDASRSGCAASWPFVQHLVNWVGMHLVSPICVLCPPEMAEDRQHEQVLQDTADTLMSEQQALVNRLQQLQQELEADSDTVKQLDTGGLALPVQAPCAAPVVQSWREGHSKDWLWLSCAQQHLMSAQLLAGICCSLLALLICAAAEVCRNRASALLRLAKLQQLHDAYKHCLGLEIRSESGAAPGPQQQSCCHSSGTSQQ